MTPWWLGIPPVELDVRCDGGVHVVRWAEGRLHLVDHGDIDDERTLARLGGVAHACLQLADLWDAALADGGFLVHWAHHVTEDRASRERFVTRWMRLHTEGVQEVLPELSPDRARVAGAAVALLPQATRDRLALTLIAGLPDRPELVAELAPWLARALAVRARSAFVASLARETAHRRPDALVPLQVAPAPEPAVSGVLRPSGSRVRLGLPVTWLVEVWGRGAQVIDGHLVVAVDATGPDGRPEVVRVVRWSPAAGVARPSIVPARVTPTGLCWSR